MKRFGAYLMRCLVAFDQFCNVVFFLGLPDETISAHAGRAMLAGTRWGKILSWCLNTIQHKHVQEAIVHDDQRAADVVKVEDAAEKER